ncbi:MAG: IS256 family transposase [Planctomycetota bacterium]
MRKSSTESRLLSREDRFGILEEALREKTRGWIEQMVNEELEAALGVGRHERDEGRVGYRKGKRSRTFTNRNGKHTIRMPRGEFFEPGADGKKAWTSKILPPYVRRSDAVEDALTMCYLSGVNTRKVRAALGPLLEGASLSRSTVSRMVAGLTEAFEAWRNRDLSGEDVAILFLDGFNLKIRLAGKVEKVPVLSVIGLCADGRRLVLCLELRSSESEAAWGGVVESLSRRGVKAPVLAVIDGCEALHSSVKEAWPWIDVQRCTKHKLENLYTHGPKRRHEELKADYDAIVYAADEGSGRRAWERFERKWEGSCPGVVKSLREAGEELLTFYQYPESMWKMLRTTNCIERVNEEYRRRVKTQGSFPNVEAGLKVCYGMLAGGVIVLRRMDGWQFLRGVVEKIRLQKGLIEAVDKVA